MSWKSDNGEVECLKSWEIGFKSGLSKEWISVKDLPPKFNKEVLILEDGYISIGEYWDYSMIGHDNGWTARGTGTANPSHWMATPIDPEAEL